MKILKIITAVTVVAAVAAGVAYGVSKAIQEKDKYIAVEGDAVSDLVAE